MQVVHVGIALKGHGVPAEAGGTHERKEAIGKRQQLSRGVPCAASRLAVDVRPGKEVQRVDHRGVPNDHLKSRLQRRERRAGGGLGAL